jgi:hypothetical protein
LSDICYYASRSRETGNKTGHKTKKNKAKKTRSKKTRSKKQQQTNKKT